MSVDTVIVDYGLGNLHSVHRALSHCGASAVICSNPTVVENAKRLVLPGVGAFRDGMAQLTAAGMDIAIKRAVDQGAHILGICLGMQLLFSCSEEYGLTSGLDLIPGRVVKLSPKKNNHSFLKVPHIGWNTLSTTNLQSSWSNRLLNDVPTDSAVYFVHSFVAIPEFFSHRLADCIYGDIAIPAVVGTRNVWGVQFHPEKSGEVGLKILRNFCKE